MIELLVVIGIISVLASVILGVMTSITNASKNLTSVNNLKNIAAACRLYANDHNGTFPMYGSSDANLRLTSGNIANSSSPPRKLFPATSPLGGTEVGGDYLGSCDVLYSPFATFPNAKVRVKGRYYNVGGNDYIGYTYYSLPRPSDQTGGTTATSPAYNRRVTDDTTAPLYSDVTTGTGSNGQVNFTGNQWNVIYLDGSMGTIPYAQVKGLGSTALIARVVQR